MDPPDIHRPARRSGVNRPAKQSTDWSNPAALSYLDEIAHGGDTLWLHGAHHVACTRDGEDWQEVPVLDWFRAGVHCPLRTTTAGRLG
jgi:hypothetical protein